MASLRFPGFSVKVVRHKNWDYFCGRLWKNLGAPPVGREVSRCHWLPRRRHWETWETLVGKPGADGTYPSFSGQAMMPENWGTSRLSLHFRPYIFMSLHFHELQGLISKIFRNKDLASDWEPLRGSIEDTLLVWLSRIWRACAFPDSQ